MATTPTATDAGGEASAAADADVTLLRADGSTAHTEPLPLEPPAGDGEIGAERFALSLRARAAPQAPDVAVLDGEAFTLSLVADGAPVLTEHVDARAFGAGATGERFTAAAGRHLSLWGAGEEDAVADALAAAFDAIRKRLADGRIQVVDRETSVLLEQTASVQFDPDAGKWTVLFDAEGYSNGIASYVRPYLSLSATEWARPDADPSPTFDLGGRRARNLGASLPPDIFQDTDVPGERAAARWRTCRAVWSRMAEATTDPEPVTVPLSEEAMKERGCIPRSECSVEDFTALVEEVEYLSRGGVPDVNGSIEDTVSLRTLRQAVRALGLADELLDVDPET